jgi:hypothetical protein
MRTGLKRLMAQVRNSRDPTHAQRSRPGAIDFEGLWLENQFRSKRSYEPSLRSQNPDIERNRCATGWVGRHRSMEVVTLRSLTDSGQGYQGPSNERRHPAAAATAAAPASSSSTVSRPENITSRPDDEETSTLIELGQDFLKKGDLLSARLLLQRAAKADSAAAALSLGETFDPFLIQRLGAIGVQPDIVQAREWYQRALQLGSNTAAEHLAKLVAPHRGEGRASLRVSR